MAITIRRGDSVSTTNGTGASQDRGQCDVLLRRIADHRCVVGIIGLGYVGVPLAVEFARSGYRAVGFDIDAAVVTEFEAGRTRVRDVSPGELHTFIAQGLIGATCDFGELAACDVVVICVPTPLSKLKDPDLSFVVAAAQTVRATLRPGQLVVLESTTYPGTTRDVLLPILAESGLTVGEDYFLCFSPERVDPGNANWAIRNTPRLIGGITERCRDVGERLYQGIVDRVIGVSSVEAAELAKVYENTFRMVNIALANELALVCARLKLDVWEVIDAAASKPFGFMRFTPGPGLGGHCIPLDPHYLSWKMETLDFKTRLIELASEINAQMPMAVANLVAEALNDEAKAVRGSHVLLLGIAYKPNVADYRESPALEIIRLLQAKGANVQYHDPHCLRIAVDAGGHLPELDMRSVDLDNSVLAEVDVVVVVTDHAAIDFHRVTEHARVVIDTRGALRNRPGKSRVIGLSGRVAESLEAVDAPMRGAERNHLA
jgi:UDP-N-acetyl-D-glucosamine dehydrogenase